jgi:hypothetical protein
VCVVVVVDGQFSDLFHAFHGAVAEMSRPQSENSVTNAVNATEAVNANDVVKANDKVNADMLDLDILRQFRELASTNVDGNTTTGFLFSFCF